MLTSNATAFISIDYTRNTHLSSSNKLIQYSESESYISFELFEDPYHTIYVADINSDGIPDYLLQIDSDHDGDIDIIMYGLEQLNQEIVWHHKIYETFIKV